MGLSLFGRPRPPKTLIASVAVTNLNVYADMDNQYGCELYSYAGGAGAVDVIDITGRGVVSLLCLASNGTPTGETFSVTIDGVVVITDTTSLANLTVANLIGSVATPTANRSSAAHSYVPFNTSFKVTVNCDVAVGIGFSHYLT